MLAQIRDPFEEFHLQAFQLVAILHKSSGDQTESTESKLALIFPKTHASHLEKMDIFSPISKQVERVAIKQATNDTESWFWARCFLHWFPLGQWFPLHDAEPLGTHSCTADIFWQGVSHNSCLHLLAVACFQSPAEPTGELLLI